MRVLISLGASLARASWSACKTMDGVSVSKAALTPNEDRAYAAVVLGQTRPDATSGELIDAAVSTRRDQLRAGPAVRRLPGLRRPAPARAEFRGQDTAPRREEHPVGSRRRLGVALARRSGRRCATFFTASVPLRRRSSGLRRRHRPARRTTGRSGGPRRSQRTGHRGRRELYGDAGNRAVKARRSAPRGMQSCFAREAATPVDRAWFDFSHLS